jgi:hypothetical protein
MGPAGPPRRARLSPVLYQDQPSPALYQQDEGSQAPTDCRLGRWEMSRLAGFYIAKAMESVTAGTAAATGSRVPPRRAGDHAARNAMRTHGRSPSSPHPVAATVRRFIDGLVTASRGRRSLRRLRLPPRGSHQHTERTQGHLGPA